MIETQQFAGASKSNTSFLTPVRAPARREGSAPHPFLAGNLPPDDADAGVVGTHSVFLVFGRE